MNRLDTKRRAAVVAALVEGNSLRATARMTGVARMTVEKLLRDLGAACAHYQDEHLRNLKTKRVQCDEIWAFCYAKQRNVTQDIAEKNPDAGDIWTWTALDPDYKLIVTWRVSGRTTTDAHGFMQDLAGRLSGRVQISVDGLSHYPPAVVNAFGEDVDLGRVVKQFSSENSGRYSPPVCVGCEKTEVLGDPDPKHISTSHVERNNLSLRMHLRRFTRLTNGFSKKAEMHAHAVALHFMHYNFAKIHQTLRVTPAMEAGISDHVWEIEEIVALLD